MPQEDEDQRLTEKIPELMQEINRQLDKLSHTELRNLAFIACNRVGMFALGGKDYTTMEEAVIGMQLGVKVVFEAYEDAKNGGGTLRQKEDPLDKAFFCPTIGNA